MAAKKNSGVVLVGGAQPAKAPAPPRTVPAPPKPPATSGRRPSPAARARANVKRRKHPVAEPGKTRAYDAVHRHALNAERQRDLLNAITLGSPLVTACLYAGVDDSTLRKWRARGEDALNVAPGRRSPTERKYAEFVTALSKSLATAAVRAQATIHQNMTTPLTQPVVIRHADGTDEVVQVPTPVEDRRLAQRAAEFHLTHRDPTNYSTQTRTELTGADGAPLEVSAETAWARLQSLLGRDPGADDDDVR